jgi:hypothetical protein
MNNEGGKGVLVVGDGIYADGAAPVVIRRPAEGLYWINGIFNPDLQREVKSLIIKPHVRMFQMVQKEKELEASHFAETLHKLNQETEFINSVLDASLDGIFVCEAIRDKSGIIVDLLIKRVNSAFMHIHKIEEPVVGRRYLSFFPSAKEIGLFELYCQVIDTATPAYNEFD